MVFAILTYRYIYEKTRKLSSPFLQTKVHEHIPLHQLTFFISYIRMRGAKNQLSKKLELLRGSSWVAYISNTPHHTWVLWACSMDNAQAHPNLWNLTFSKDWTLVHLVKEALISCQESTFLKAYISNQGGRFWASIVVGHFNLAFYHETTEYKAVVKFC